MLLTTSFITYWSWHQSRRTATRPSTFYTILAFHSMWKRRSTGARFARSSASAKMISIHCLWLTRPRQICKRRTRWAKRLSCLTYTSWIWLGCICRIRLMRRLDWGSVRKNLSRLWMISSASCGRHYSSTRQWRCSGPLNLIRLSQWRRLLAKSGN